MATEEIQISELELADSLLEDMLFPVESATDTKAATLLQLKKWLGSSLPTGFILPAIGRIDDARFTLLDGKTLSRNGTYSEFCNKVIEQVQLGNWFACSQSEYDEDLSSKGQCGRFVIEDDYVRIPTITRYIGATVTLSEFGQAFNESLPNITGTFLGGDSEHWGQKATGAFEDTEIAEVKWSGGQSLLLQGKKLNASHSSSTYQDGAKVNVEHVKYPYYMVISTEGKTTPISVDINKVYEDINLKANKDLSDVTQIGKETVVGWGMPDYTAGVDIKSALTTDPYTWTAPCDGIIKAFTADNTTWNINYGTSTTLDQTGRSDNLLFINGERYVFLTSYFPISKGETIATSERNGNTIFFYPYKGVI